MFKGLRFQKRLKLLPGLRINLSKSGASATVGTRGAGVNISPGGITTNAGIPGTGISYRQKLTPKNRSAWIGVVTLVAGLTFAAWQNREAIAAWVAPETPPPAVAAAALAPPPAPQSSTMTPATASKPAALGIRAQAAKLLVPGGAIYVRRGGSVLREEQKMSGTALKKLAKGASVTVIAVDGPWTQVKDGDTTGWMRTSVLGPNPN